MGTFIVPALCIPSLLFSGFFIKYNEMPAFLQPLSHISFFRFGFEGAINAIYGFDRDDLKCVAIYCHFRNAKQFLNYMDMTGNNYWLDIAGLAGWIVFLQVTLYVVLRVKLNKAQ